MDKIDELLRYVKRTNPEMIRERLIYKLGECYNSALGLIMTWKNSEKQAV